MNVATDAAKIKGLTRINFWVMHLKGNLAEEHSLVYSSFSYSLEW